MRNGVIAFRRDGTLALMNDEAYRIFALERSPGDVGRPYVDVLRERPPVIRVLSGVFELDHLPNRAELRLKELDRVIGYTLSQVKNDEGTAIGLLRRQVPTEGDAQSLLADIISEAKLANAIVVEMLEFVRPVRLQVERTDVADVLQQSVTLAETKVPRRGVDLKVDLEAGLPAIEGDQHQLCQVFTNLLANAFEALDGKGHVTITGVTGMIEMDPAMSGADPPTPTVVIDVLDDGPGVPPDATDKIFDPFFTTKPQGSGLGLAIVRKIVDAHDGRIDLSSTPGKGTRFRVTLPVASASSWFK